MNKKRKKIFILFLILMCFNIVNAEENIVVPSGTLNSCSEILGANLTAITKEGITIVQIVGAIIAIIKGMMTLIPPILAKDADALNKASKTLAIVAIVLIVLFISKPLLLFLGNLLDFDTSCII